MTYNCYKRKNLVISITCSKMHIGDDCYTFLNKENEVVTKIAKSIVKKVEDTNITLK